MFAKDGDVDREIPTKESVALGPYSRDLITMLESAGSFYGKLPSSRQNFSTRYAFVY